MYPVAAGHGRDRRFPPGRLTLATGSGDRYRLGHLSVGSHELQYGRKVFMTPLYPQRARLNVQSGVSKLRRANLSVIMGIEN